MTAELHPQQIAARLQRAALAHLLNAAMPSHRLYSTREAALGTASYETLIRSRGPMGALTWPQAQNAISRAAVGLGIAQDNPSIWARS